MSILIILDGQGYLVILDREKCSYTPLNFQPLVETPLELFYWPIYSINYTHLPIQYIC